MVVGGSQLATACATQMVSCVVSLCCTASGFESAARMMFEVAGSARRTGQGAYRRPLATPLAPMVRETPAKTAFARRRQFAVC